MLDLDTLITTYDFDQDDVLKQQFVQIEKDLLQQIKDYGKEFGNYGEVLYAHLMRTSLLNKALLSKLRFSDMACNNLYHANFLHDLGKTHADYDPQIWQTQGRPTEDEGTEKRLHTQRGNELFDQAIPDDLQDHPHIQLVRALQLYHHERLNGFGYENLPASQQGLVLQSVCLIDAYDGDRIHRPHQPRARTVEEALDRLCHDKKYEDGFAPNMLSVFRELILSPSHAKTFECNHLQP